MGLAFGQGQGDCVNVNGLDGGDAGEAEQQKNEDAQWADRQEVRHFRLSFAKHGRMISANRSLGRTATGG